MRNTPSRNNTPHLNAWRGLGLWLGIHLLVFILFIFFGNSSVNTDLYSILPPGSTARQLAVPAGIMDERFTSGITVLVGHPTFEEAKTTALSLASTLRGLGFSRVQDRIDPESMNEMSDFLFTNRYLLMRPDIRTILEEKDQETLVSDAFARLVNPFSPGGLEYIDMDPYLLTTDLLEHYLQSGFLKNSTMGLRDGVLCREYNGENWVLLRAGVPGGGFTIDSKENPLEKLYTLKKHMEEEDGALKIVFSGVPFHSYASARASENEIRILSLLSTLFILILIIFVFRSFFPLLGALFAITAAVLSGLGLSMTVFNDLHIFTIVFGTSLIGISVDYIFHYFCDWGGHQSAQRGETVSRVIPGIRLGLITTVISYGAFMLAGFPLLRQMAVFSVAGLVSTYLTVKLIFPLLPAAPGKTRRSVDAAASHVHQGFLFLSGMDRKAKLLLCIPIIIVILIGGAGFQLSNDVRQFYTMGDELLAAESLASEILGTGKGSSYVLIDGASTQEVLRKEEAFIDALNPEIDDDVRVLGITGLIPSVETQKRNYRAAQKVLPRWVDQQYADLGFSVEYAEKWKEDFRSQAGRVLVPEDVLDEPFLEPILSMLWIGNQNGGSYTAVLITGLDNISVLSSAADSIPGIYVIDKVGDINAVLQRISIFSLTAVLAAYVVIFLFLLPRYAWRTALKLVGIPALASLFAASVISLGHQPIQLFVIMGCILVPGMGTDYIIFTIEDKTCSASTYLAVTMSMATTVLSFGMLGFTTFLGLFGITVGVGIMISYLLTALFFRAESY